jgi:hypothetical protein
VFLCDADYKYYLENMIEAKCEFLIKVYAYCLMTNGFLDLGTTFAGGFGFKSAVIVGWRSIGAAAKDAKLVFWRVQIRSQMG